MAEDRKIFPVEQVLELITGKKDADTDALVSFVTGRANLGGDAAKAATPFAYAWLVRWYPKFMDMEWKEDQAWEAFVRQASHILGEHVSLTPMSGRLKTLANETFDAITDCQSSLARQTDTAVKLEKEVKVLEPLKSLLDAAQKKNDELEGRIKTMKSDMQALNRKLLEFEGKVPMDQEELKQSIKDAIKDGLKGISIATAAAGAAPATEEGQASSANVEKSDAEDDWGFGTSTSSDEFGF